ncbi:hypothetical protein GCM10007916_01640 [Psychromonas marina]|uniref:Type I restriction modification DNA specificity domain-containing protein n=1 Tax=Psychromonas marina TaxID=88364 RepID=A0ABQ6DVK6_9GAMM|nr:restriction endonuclease subunit S [Psychromonas marina]GLS89097.1 hypothetical protein GCM10007916_01640 [Psychromonas marina]
MNWPLVKLEDIFEIARGGSPRPIADYITEEEDGLNWISIKDASNSEKYITTTKLKIRKEGLKKSRLVKEGDFLLTNSMSFGRPYIMKTTGCIHDGWLVLSSDSKVVNQDYFYHLLGSPFLHRIFSKLAAGAVVKNLNIDLVKNVEIPLPSVEEQKQIAEILDAADSLRQKDQLLIGHYERLSQSLFLGMFGDPVSNPMGWEALCLEDMVDFLTSGSRGWAKYYSDCGDVFIRIQNVGKNELLLDDITYVDAPDSAESKRTAVQTGDILLSITADLGRTAVIPKEFPKAYINQHLALIRLKKGYNPDYVSEFIASEGGKRQFMKLDKGGVKAGLNFTDIKSLKLLNPPVSLQNQYMNNVKKIKEQKLLAEESLIKSNDLFNSLLHRAFKGELTVS